MIYSKSLQNRMHDTQPTRLWTTEDSEYVSLLILLSLELKTGQGWKLIGIW